MGPLVGRVEELASAVALLTRTDAPGGRARPGVLAVVGEPGIGKTRLLAELRSEAISRGHLVINGGATEFEQHLPFGALAESLGDWLRSDHQASARCRQRVAELYASLSGASTDQWFGLHRETRAVLEDLAATRGLVVVLDDLHWADAASIELIGYLLRRPPRHRFVLALGYRPRQVDHRVEDAVHRATAELAERLELRPLSTAEGRQLVGPDLPRARFQAVYRDSGGNPLFLKALGGAATAQPGPLPPEDGDLPPAVHAALLTEIRGLPTTALTVARAAAVAGDPFEPELIAAIAEVDSAGTARMIDELVHRDLVQQVGSAPRFRFRHPLLRRIVYNAIPSGWRRDAHRRAATALCRQGAAPITRAHHVARSASPGDQTAATLLAEAARSTLWQAPATAAWLLDESLRLLPATSDQPHRPPELIAALARSLALAGRLTAGRDVAHRSLSELPRGRTAARAETAIVTAMIDRLLGRHAEARAVLLSELANLDHDQHAGTACALRVELVTGGLLAGDFTSGRQEIMAAVAAARSCGDRPLQAAAAAVLAFTCYAAGRLDEARDRLDEARQRVDALCDGELTRRLDAAVWLAWAELFLEHYDRAIEHFDRALILVRTTGQSHLLTYILVGKASAQLQLGHIQEASDWAADAVEAAELSGSDELRTMAYTLQCLSATRAGDRKSAMRAGKLATSAAGSVRDWWSSAAGLAYGQAQLAVGVDPLRCVEQMLSAGGGPRLTHLDPGSRPFFYEALAHAELAKGDPAAALAWVDTMDSAVADLGRCANYRSALAQLLRSEVLLATGEPAQAANHAVRLLDALPSSDARFLAARARLVAGRALTETGDRREGLRHLRRAQTIFVEIGANRFADRAVRAQRGVGHRAVRHDQGGPDVAILSRRETEVAHLLTKGHTNRQIAQRLLLSIRTVETHVRHICTKLDVSTRTAVAAAIARHEASA